MVPIKKHLGYLISCTKYVRDMGTRKRLLEAKILGVENHVTRNKSNNLEVPTEVEGWLEEVAKINAQVESIPSDIGSCFNIKLRHKLGRRAFKINEEINRVIEENSTIIWTDHPIPLGKVDFMKASTSTPSETLVDNENGGVDAIKLPALKFLFLGYLPKLMTLCNDVNAIELPRLDELILKSLPNFTSIYANGKSGDVSTMQPLLNKEVVISQLKKLEIDEMEKLTEIWPSDTEEVGLSELRVITVERCDSVVNLFPSNPMSLLHHLEELTVGDCGSIDVIFNIDLERVGEIEKSSICLRKIHVHGLRKLKELWKIKGAYKSELLICCVEHLQIEDCMRFRNIFTLTISEINVISNEEMAEVGDSISNVVVPYYLIHNLHHLHTIFIENCNQVDVVFEIDITSSSKLETTQQPLKDLKLKNMECMSHVWKCYWNKFLIPHKQQPEGSSSSFHNLTTIELHRCKNVKYLFSPLMAKILSNLKDVTISSCDVIEEVVSSRDADEDEDEEMTSFRSTNTSTNLFPHLDILCLWDLPNLKHIGGGEISFGNTNTTTSIHDQFKFSQESLVLNVALTTFRTHSLV
ncbi:hypothetical protein L6452_07997 [Arctium lappa]|uniref:Uncharacterized protein n=1 Tax=Arctium lappa TaxID=4217 RepID=A0ACB9DGK4_ARCLA|nr:hypothetical protein L6452_07997 [Arctium lappa]